MKHDQKIETLFDTIAAQYDKTNDIMSFGLHRIWNQRFVSTLKQIQSQEISPIENLRNDFKVLDLCCGTGELTIRHATKNTSYTLFDLSKEMLEIAEMRIAQHPILKNQAQYLRGNAKDLPFPDNSFDLVMVSYGIRNIDDIEQAFREVYRVLKPRGIFGILELTRPENRFLHMMHRTYLDGFIPFVGKYMTKNADAYRHLQESITNFMSLNETCMKLKSVGFDIVQTSSYHGGISTAFIVKKA